MNRTYTIAPWAGRWATWPDGDPSDVMDHDSLEEALAWLRVLFGAT